eukprot:305622-Pyramimonas_sp.AAC.1
MQGDMTCGTWARSALLFYPSVQAHPPYVTAFTPHASLTSLNNDALHYRASLRYLRFASLRFRPFMLEEGRRSTPIANLSGETWNPAPRPGARGVAVQGLAPIRR